MEIFDLFDGTLVFISRHVKKRKRLKYHERVGLSAKGSGLQLLGISLCRTNQSSHAKNALLCGNHQLHCSI